MSPVMSKVEAAHRILADQYSAYTCNAVYEYPYSVPGLLIVCAPGLFRAGTLLGGLTRDGLLAIIGVTLSNSAIPQYRADNRLRAGDSEKSMDSLYPWLSSAVVLSVSPPVSLRNEKYTYCARKA